MFCSRDPLEYTHRKFAVDDSLLLTHSLYQNTTPATLANKQEHSDNDDDLMRHISQCTKEMSGAAEEAAKDWEESMEEILTTHLWRDNEDVLKQAMHQLVDIMTDDDIEHIKRQELFFHLGSHVTVVRTMNAES